VDTGQYKGAAPLERPKAYDAGLEEEGGGFIVRKTSGMG